MEDEHGEEHRAALDEECMANEVLSGPFTEPFFREQVLTVYRILRAAWPGGDDIDIEDE